MNEIRTAFEELSNADIARQMAAYMRNKFTFYGIPTPARRAVYKLFIKESKKAGRIDWRFVDECWADEHREFQYVALDYLSAMSKFLSFNDIPTLERYVRTKQWWDSIDGLDRIIGDIGLTDARVDELMLLWSTDHDFWVRRVAIDHQLGRREKTNCELLEKIIINNFGSNEFFINKAIGWSLREYSKTNPTWVRDFIKRHQPDMSPLSVREASKYC